MLFEPLEGFDFFDVPLDNNESDKSESGFYPGYRHRFFGLYSIGIGYFPSKIDMLTCRSAQAFSYESLKRFVTALIFAFICDVLFDLERHFFL